MIDGLRFSPDGSELAAIAEHGNRLLCWNSQAKLTVNHKLEGMSSWSGSFGFHGSQIDWAPNGKAWLLAGRLLIDRESLRPLWVLKAGWIHSARARFLDSDHIVATMGDSSHQRLTSLPIPWAKLNASLAALNSSTPAYLRPGQSISVQVKLGEVRHGDPETTKTELGKVALEKMKQLGVSVGSSQPLILLVYYTEKAGETVAVYERRNRFDFRGTDTGQRVEDTKASIQISLWESGAKQPLWKGKLQAGSASSYKDDINEQTVRDSTFKNASNQLRGIMFPYFMPKDPNLVSLPAVTEL
jgi:hypothetical protein